MEPLIMTGTCNGRIFVFVFAGYRKKLDDTYVTLCGNGRNIKKKQVVTMDFELIPRSWYSNLDYDSIPHTTVGITSFKIDEAVLDSGKDLTIVVKFGDGESSKPVKVSV